MEHIPSSKIFHAPWTSQWCISIHCASGRILAWPCPEQNKPPDWHHNSCPSSRNAQHHMQRPVVISCCSCSPSKAWTFTLYKSLSNSTRATAAWASKRTQIVKLVKVSFIFNLSPLSMRSGVFLVQPRPSREKNIRKCPRMQVRINVITISLHKLIWISNSQKCF
jgi:hypothetical protein